MQLTQAYVWLSIKIFILWLFSECCITNVYCNTELLLRIFFCTTTYSTRLQSMTCTYIIRLRKELRNEHNKELWGKKGGEVILERRGAKSIKVVLKRKTGRKR